LGTFRTFLQSPLASLAIVALTVATRFAALQHPQPIDDEAVYSVVGNEIVDGGRPYADVVERKPPLLFWVYAAVFKVAGKFNWKALHLVALIWTLGTMGGLYVAGRRLFDRETGLLAAFFYALYQPWAVFQNLAFNGELLMNLPLVWAWALAFKRGTGKYRPELLVAGALLCAGFLLKQPAAIAAVPLGVYLLLPSYRASRGLTFAQSVTQAGTLTAGFLGALVLVAIVLWKQGVLSEAFYWTFTNHSIPHVFWKKGALMTLAFIVACFPLILGTALAGRDRDGVWSEKSAERMALIGLVAASAVGMAAGARFYPHYYIQLVPPLALLAAPHFARLWSGDMQTRRWFLRPAVACAWLAGTLFIFSIAHWRGLASVRTPCEAGQYLFQHSAPNDRIFVWGQAPEIYLEAQRRPACRYVVTFPLTGYIFGGIIGIDTHNRIVPGAWANLEHDFAAHPPIYIVDVQVPAKNEQYPVKNFPILARFLSERYSPIARTADGVIYRMR
jgi:4-amino-4-deoxy-L-arabinose transferase-like glycosyltransferase